jgi:protein involved in polysaccharide export with SLBB domain
MRSLQHVAARVMLAVLLVQQVSVCTAQTDEVRIADYRIGTGDVLRLNVLDRSELDRELTVQTDGTAFLPQVGEVIISGLTVAEAEMLIRQRLRLFDPGIADVTLQIVQYNALRVYVLGAVSNPGAHTFTTMPTIWDAIRAAGGPRENASLSAVRVISQRDGRPRTQSVNLAGIYTGGEIPEIILNSGDTVIVPSIGEGATPAAAAAPDGVQIIGAVSLPSVVPIEGPTRLLTCLMMAGAPVQLAELDKVWWVHQTSSENFTSRRIELSLYFETGDLAGNPLIHPGDSIHLEYQRPGWFQTFWPLFLGTVATTATVLLAYDRITRD